MSENKCCGNCKSFIPSIDGFGACTEPTSIYGVHCNNEACSLFKMKSNSGWTKITPDNVDEINADLIVITDGTFYKMANDWYTSLSTLAEEGGYYHYVLPELNIE